MSAPSRLDMASWKAFLTDAPTVTNAAKFCWQFFNPSAPWTEHLTKNLEFIAIISDSIPTHEKGDTHERTISIAQFVQICDQHTSMAVTSERLRLLADYMEIDISPKELGRNESSTAPTDLKLVEYRDELVRVFGPLTGMEMSWFCKDKPELYAARRVKGKGGRKPTEPKYCPFEVTLWLCNAKRKVGKHPRAASIWGLFEKNFPAVYKQHEHQDPRILDQP